MVNKFLKLIKDGEYKTIFSNFMSLSVLQGANLILPLITFPYLVRTLDVDKYGLVVFAQAFIAYFALAADYGFNLSGIREISLYKNNFLKLTRTYNSILIARLGLVIVGFLVMSLIVLSIDKFSENWKLYFLTYGMVFGTALFPTWFFQGMQKMKYITILTVVAKTIFTISIFFLVKSPSDYLWVPFLNSVGFIVVGIISLIIINKQFKIPFALQNFKYIYQQLQKGWFIFISKISTNFYTATTTFVLGLVTNTTLVGYYVIAEKVVRIITAMFSPLIQAIYPHVVELTKKSKEETIIFLRKILKYTLVITIIIWTIGFIFAEPTFNLVFNKDVDHSILLFRILSPLIIILPIAALLFNVALLSFKMDSSFFKIYLTGGLLNVVLLGLFLFVLELSTIGAAMSLLICETVITIYAAFILKSKNIKLLTLNL